MSNTPEFSDFNKWVIFQDSTVQQAVCDAARLDQAQREKLMNKIPDIEAAPLSFIQKIQLLAAASMVGWKRTMHPDESRTVSIEMEVPSQLFRTEDAIESLEVRAMTLIGEKLLACGAVKRDVVQLPSFFTDPIVLRYSVRFDPRVFDNQ